MPLHNDAILLPKLVDKSEYYRNEGIHNYVIMNNWVTSVIVAMMSSFDRQDITVGALQLQDIIV